MVEAARLFFCFGAYDQRQTEVALCTDWHKQRALTEDVHALQTAACSTTQSSLTRLDIKSHILQPIYLRPVLVRHSLTSCSHSTLELVAACFPIQADYRPAPLTCNVSVKVCTEAKVAGVLMQVSIEAPACA